MAIGVEPASVVAPRGPWRRLGLKGLTPPNGTEARGRAYYGGRAIVMPGHISNLVVEFLGTEC